MRCSSRRYLRYLTPVRATRCRRTSERSVLVHLPAAGRDRARYRRHDGPPRGARPRRAERPVVLVSDSERGLDRRASRVCRWRRALSRAANHPAPVAPGPAGPRPRTHQDIGPLTAPTRLTHVDALVRWRASPCARLARRRPVCRRRRRGRVREHLSHRPRKPPA